MKRNKPIKRVAFILLIFCWCITLWGNETSERAVFTVEKGVNVASWLSGPKYDGEERVNFFTEENVKQLSELGFDHIRLSVDEEVLFDIDGNRIRAYAFDLLHNGIQWCMNHKMKIIIDLHTTRNHRFTKLENDLFTNPGEDDKFVKIWQSLSEELRQYPNSVVAYELLNEPVTGSPEVWNRVIDKAVSTIRKSEPFRTIIIGVCTNSNYRVMYDTLQLPDSQNLIMTFHVYAPYLLTAYGQMDTTDGRTDIPIQYPGQLVPDKYIHLLPEKWQPTGKEIFNKEKLRPFVTQGINCAKRLQVPVYIGEFGTLYSVPKQSRENWYRDIVSLMKEYEAPYCSWDYKGFGYSIVDKDNKVEFPELVNIMVK